MSTKLEPKPERLKPGPKPLPPEYLRTARLSMRTYPDIEAKAKRLGTERIEEMIRRAKE
jgi:hypothetical protein